MGDYFPEYLLTELRSLILMFCELSDAARFGSIVAVKAILHSSQKEERPRAFLEAIIHGHSDVAQLIMDYHWHLSFDLYGFLLYYSMDEDEGYGIDARMMDYLLSLNSSKLNNQSLVAAAIRGNLKDVERLVNEGANTLDYALCAAAKQEHIDVMLWLLQNGATNLNTAIQEVCSVQPVDLHLVKHLVYATDSDIMGTRISS